MTLLPATIDEAETIEEVTHWVDVVRDRMSTDASHAWLQATLQDFLRRGLIETLRVIEAADAGDQIADAALRRVAAEMADAGLELPVTLKAYSIKALVRGPVTRSRGRSSFNNWRRDIGIACLVHLVMKRFGLAATRNREQKRRHQPSACSVVAAALGRTRINITEKTTEGIYRGLAGRFTSFATRHFPDIF
jgi:hypothetical protein